LIRLKLLVLFKALMILIDFLMLTPFTEKIHSLELSSI